MDLDTLTDADRVALMEQAYSSVEEVCSQLEPDDWDRATDCPGWTVKDNLSHLVSYEGIIQGRPAAPEDVDISGSSWVDDDVAVLNEREIQWRRPRSAEEILDEFREVTAERTKALAAMGEDEWAATLPSPFGPLPARDLIGIRILDFFFHEQDIRRATDRAGHLDGDVARFCFQRMASLAMPRVVAKGAGAPDGSLVVFDIGPPGRRFAVTVEGGRGRLVEAGAGGSADDAAEPTVLLATDLETFLCLSGGRWSPSYARAAGRLRVEGDAQLAGRILDRISVTP